MSCYFALFLPDDRYPGLYDVSFPDLPGCTTFGSSLNDALAQAVDALAGYLEVEMDSGEEVPEASDLETARKKAETQAKALKIEIPASAIYQLVCAEPKIIPPEALRIWMHRGLFTKVKILAKAKGVSVSQLLSDAALEYVKKEAQAKS